MALYMTRNHMLLCLIVTTLLSLAMVIPTFIAPHIVSKFYIPAFIIINLLLGVVFLVEGLGLHIPLIHGKLFQSTSGNLIMGFLQILCFVFSFWNYLNERSKIKRIELILLISRVAFKENWFLILVAASLSILSLVALNLNITFIWKTQNPDS